MSSLLRRLIVAPIAGAALLVTAAGGALAAEPAGTVAVFNADGTPAGATVCEFYVEFSPVDGGEEGTWELWDSGGAVVADGSYSVTTSTGHREPSSGAWSLANGTYTLAWDNEDEVDSSRSEVEIVVECAAPTQSVAAETDAPTQSVAAETDAPSQDVGGDTDAPEQTLPDTAAFDQPARPDPAAWIGALATILGLAAFALVLTPARQPNRRR